MVTSLMVTLGETIVMKIAESKARGIRDTMAKVCVCVYVCARRVY